MLLDYYNLKEQPFGVTPDPRYLYPSPTHREALASLSYAIGSGRGFMSLIAKPGMGKTTILFQLLSQLEGSTRTVFLFQTLCSPKELLRGLLRGLGVVDDGGNAIRMQGQLNNMLLAEARQGRRVVVVIDEAQNLKDSALELVRMLSNFESTSDKLMQIILAGQPRLREKLASPHLLQLRQRMSIFARLHPFSVEETRLYVRHRLQVAGYDFKTPLFTPQAGALIAKYSEGIPRVINNICFNALSLGFVLKQKSIQEEVVRESLDDLGIEAGGANDPDEEPAGSKLVDFGASKPTTVSQQPFGWLRRLAACIMLLLQLVCFTGGRQRPEARGSHSLLAVGATSQMGTIQVTSAVPTDRRSSTDNGERQPTKSVPRISADETSRSPEAVSSTPTPKSRQHHHGTLQRTSDPAKLWAQVKNQSSDAEVELARLYLEGTAVPQNCAQAQVLLLAASRRKNPRAVDLLNDYDRQCR
ncbi:MAG: AAA family ATPase [Terriglobales bacterium]